MFSRAVERGNVVIAEATARELGASNARGGPGVAGLYAEQDPISLADEPLPVLTIIHHIVSEPA